MLSWWNRIRDYRAGLAYAEKQGIEKGRQQGIQQGADQANRKAVIAMIQKDFDNEMIKYIVEGISDDQINAIRKELGE